MMFKIAWRNIWRNKRRSIIILTSVIIGLIAIILYNSLTIGSVNQMFDNQIGSHISHIQIHEKGFHDDRIIQKVVPNPDGVEQILQEDPSVSRYSKRVITYGLVSSASNSSGAMIVGVVPDLEEHITKIKQSLVSGNYLTGKAHEIVIGKKLAEKLDVGLGDKVVAMASTTGGDVGADVFRIVGIFKTFSSDFDMSTIYLPIGNTQTMLEMGSAISEFAIRLHDVRKVEEIKTAIAGKLDGSYEVLSYADIIPMLVMMMEMTNQMLALIYIIVGLALIFGIINTMLMAVFERIQEFGVLMAIGMKNSRLFFMIVLEALILGLLGSVIGFVLGYLIYLPLSYTGIDFGMFSESLSAFGIGTVIYPVLSINEIINSIVIIPMFAVLGALYPAFKAVRFHPVTAIRYV